MEWKTSWSYLPIDYGCSLGTIENITQRTSFWNNLSGDKIRIKFSNLYGVTPLYLEKVVLAQKSDEILTEFVSVLKNGQERIVVNPGEEFYSDEINWKIEAGTEIILSIYFKEISEIQSACSSHSGISWNSQFSENGCYLYEQDFTKKCALDTFPQFCKYPDPNTLIIGVCEIQIYTSKNVQTLMLFGDSIIHHSHFADALTKMLYEKYPGAITIVNRGLSGNRILHGPTYAGHIPGAGSIYGKAVMDRFEKDCFESGIPEHIIFQEGTNDMIFPEWFERPEEAITALDMSEAIAKLAEIAHEKGCKFWIGNILPYQQPGNPVCPEGEKIRKELNAWIYGQKIADGVLDFVKVLANEENESSLKENIHIGDWIHPNQQGGKMMAEEVLAVVFKNPQDNSKSFF